jgi:hypothetical protein
MKKIAIVFTTFIIIAIFWVSMSQLIEYSRDGCLNDNDDYTDVLQHLNGYAFLTTDPKNQEQLYKHNSPWIAHASFPILWKYKIENLGLIPRWTKMHDLLEHYYDSLKACDTRMSKDRWAR